MKTEAIERCIEVAQHAGRWADGAAARAELAALVEAATVPHGCVGRTSCSLVGYLHKRADDAESALARVTAERDAMIKLLEWSRDELNASAVGLRVAKEIDKNLKYESAQANDAANNGGILNERKNARMA